MDAAGHANHQQTARHNALHLMHACRSPVLVRACMVACSVLVLTLFVVRLCHGDKHRMNRAIIHGGMGSSHDQAHRLSEKGMQNAREPVQCTILTSSLHYCAGHLGAMHTLHAQTVPIHRHVGLSACRRWNRKLTSEWTTLHLKTPFPFLSFSCCCCWHLIVSPLFAAFLVLVWWRFIVTDELGPLIHPWDDVSIHRSADKVVWIRCSRPSPSK